VSSGTAVQGSDDHEVDVFHPDIDLDKSANPPSANPGDTVTFSYSVLNSGDVDLFDVSVDDDVLGHIGDIPVLAAGETVVLTATQVLGDSSVTNIGLAGGTDPLGLLVTDDDTVTVDVVLGEVILPPAAPAPQQELPRTGADVGRLVTVGIVALFAGLALVVLSVEPWRRRQPAVAAVRADRRERGHDARSVGLLIVALLLGTYVGKRR
jgi:hypothetical protein